MRYRWDTMTSDLIATLTLGMRDTPSHYVLSFCEISLNLLQYFLSYCWDKILTSDLIATLILGVGT